MLVSLGSHSWDLEKQQCNLFWKDLATRPHKIPTGKKKIPTKNQLIKITTYCEQKTKQTRLLEFQELGIIKLHFEKREYKNLQV